MELKWDMKLMEWCKKRGSDEGGHRTAWPHLSSKRICREIFFKKREEKSIEAVKLERMN